MKFVSKERKGSQVMKKYDKPQTPYQRLLASAKVSEAVKDALREKYKRLYPVELLRQIEHQQNVLWQYAHRPATTVTAHPPVSLPREVDNSATLATERQS